MQVISKRAFLFIDYAATRKATRKCSVVKSAGPQEAPDWLRELPSFQHAVKAGEIREVKFVAEPEPESKAAETEDEDRRPSRAKK